jgi:hypothetical protein
LNKKDTEWLWGKEQEEAFQFLKDCLIKLPIRRYPYFSRDFIINMDASGFGVSSVLAQVQIVQGEEKEVHCIYIKTSLKESGHRVRKKKMLCNPACNKSILILPI